MKNISSLSGMLRSGELTPSELTRRCLENIKRDNPRLNALVSVTEGYAFAAAARADELIKKGEGGALAGIPFVLKDNICTKGILTTCCSRMLENYVPPYSATVFERLESSGAVLVGKANMDEFTMGSTGHTSVFGAAVNPLCESYIAGGSSSGTAVAVAGGFVPFGLGSDTGGSVRQPAALCGVVGFKPTYGSLSRYGLIAHASSLDTIGIITRSVGDASLVFDCIRGRDNRDMTSAEVEPSTPVKDIGNLKIGVIPQLFESCSDEVVKAVKGVICASERVGAEVKEFDCPEFRHSLSAYHTIAAAEASSNLARYDGVRYGYPGSGKSFKECAEYSRTNGFGREVKRRILFGTLVISGEYSGGSYKNACAVRRAISKRFEDIFRECDIVLAPTVPSSHYAAGDYANGQPLPYESDFCTAPASLAGIPAVSLPCGGTVGLQVMARRGSDLFLLAAAARIEKLNGEALS